MAAQAKLEDSNISNYGSKEHKDLKLAAAQSEEAWKGAGKAPGIQVWRVEKFKIIPRTGDTLCGDEKKAIKLYSGDAYIILYTYRAKDAEGKETEKLLYNVHFWLGKDCSQDEQGTAAYKTVELDDLLGDLPVQYREVQGEESEQFGSYFPGGIRTMDGGVDSGFNKVEPEKYRPRLLHLKGQKTIRVSEVKCEWKSLNDGDAFILDAGLTVFQWNGKTAGINEKRKANEMINALKKERNGKPKSAVLDDLEDNADFWKLLGGKPAKGQIAPATSDEEKKAAAAKPKVKQLIELSDASGELKTTKIDPQGGSYKRSQLKKDEVFILDLGNMVWVWIGSGASKNERAKAIQYGTEHLVHSGRSPTSCPVSRVTEGHEPKAFTQEFA
jgi:hypothetical protein